MNHHDRYAVSRLHEQLGEAKVPAGPADASRQPRPDAVRGVRTDFTVRRLEPGDIALLEPVLREHIRDMHTGEVLEPELASVLACMAGTPDATGRIRHYYVACDGMGAAFACMAVSTPDVRMLKHFETNDTESVELLNAFVKTEHMGGKGVGRALFNAIRDHGRRKRARYLLVNSGPRYKRSWGFYDRLCDSTHGYIDDYYGPTRHAKTWRTDLKG